MADVVTDHVAEAPGGCMCLVPEGRRQEISRGQVRPGGRSPRLLRRGDRAPAGHRRIVPCGVVGATRSPSATSRKAPGNSRAQKISSMPRWGKKYSLPEYPGAAPAAGLPPANFLWCPSGTGSRRRAGGPRPRRPHTHGVVRIFHRSIPIHALRPGTGRAPFWLRLRRASVPPDASPPLSPHFKSQLNPHAARASQSAEK